MYFRCLFVLPCFHLSDQKYKPIQFLNQNTAYKVVEGFAPGILSFNKYEHSAPSFSPFGSRALSALADSKGNKTILYGGIDGSGNTFNDGVWEFDGVEWKNSATKFNPLERIFPGYVFDSKRNVSVLFGVISKVELMDDLWSWDSQEWKLFSTEGTSGRTMGYLAYDKERDKIVLFGGRLEWPNDAGDMWVCDGKKWREALN